MCQYAVEVFAALVDYCCKTDDLGSCANDYEEFETAVVLELHVAIVCFQFHGCWFKDFSLEMIVERIDRQCLILQVKSKCPVCSGRRSRYNT